MRNTLQTVSHLSQALVHYNTRIYSFQREWEDGNKESTNLQNYYTGQIDIHMITQSYPNGSKGWPAAVVTNAFVDIQMTVIVNTHYNKAFVYVDDRFCYVAEYDGDFRACLGFNKLPTYNELKTSTLKLLHTVQLPKSK